MLASASPVWEIAQSEPLTLLALSQSVDGGPLEAIARMDAHLLASSGGSVLGLEDLGGDGGARGSGGGSGGGGRGGRGGRTVRGSRNLREVCRR